jgi:ferritin-like metal-binding protein YciE
VEKAYNLKDLGEMIANEARNDGLQVAEEALEKLGVAVYIGLKQWAKESAALSENKVDDLLAKFLDYADPYVLEQIARVNPGHSAG